MAFEDLFQGLNMFKQGVQEYTASKAIGDATEQLNQLNQSAASDQEKRVAQMQLGSQVALHLQQLGAPQAQIAGVSKELKPIDYSNPMDMYMQAKLTGKTDQANLAQQLQKTMVTDPAAKVAAQHQAYALQQIEATAKNKYEIALLKAQAGGKDLKPVSDAHIEKLSTYDNGMSTVADLVSRVEDQTASVGPFEGNKPWRSLVANSATFDADLGRMVALYRKEITGTGMSKDERKELNANMPSNTDTKSVFLAKAAKLQEIAAREKERYLTNLSKSGRDVSGFAPDRAAAIAPPQQQDIRSVPNKKTGKIDRVIFENGKPVGLAQ